MHFPQRESLLPSLRRLLNSHHSGIIYLHGSYHTGKLSTLKAALRPDTQLSLIDCVLSHSDRALFSAILGAPCSPDPATFFSRLANLPDQTNRVIALDRADRLAHPPFTPTAIAALLQLCTQPRLILLCRSPWAIFRAALGVGNAPAPAPPQLFFPAYTEKEAVDALVIDHPQSTDVRLRPFIELVVSVLYPTTADLRELSKVVASLYPHYLSGGGSGPEETFKPIVAFNRVRDRLAGALYALYRTQHVDPKSGNASRKRPADVSILSTKGIGMSEDLSKAAKTLLVAAFLASRNPPTHDMRFFTTERTRRAGGSRKSTKITKQTGRQKSGAAKAVTVDGGTKTITRAFPLERLLAIFEAIRPDDPHGNTLNTQDPGSVSSVSAALSTGSLVQISTLVTLQLLRREGGGDLLSETRYRCNLSQTMAAGLARSLRIELDQYLYKE